MACTSPKCFVIPPKGSGFRARYVKNRFDWKPAGTKTPNGWTYTYLPCGGCLACRIERRQEITILQMLKMQTHTLIERRKRPFIICLVYREIDASIIEREG